jgi:hypothetical protein
MLKAIFILLISLITVPTANAEIWGLNQVLEATCRVTAGNGYGSGSCIGNKDGQYIVLTNAHVVGNSDTVRLEFFKNGRKTLPLPGKVVFRKLIESSSIDYALISVNESYFGKDKKYAPRVAPLAPINAEVVGGYVMSAGCPGARWPSGFEGFIIKQDSEQILFYPPPLGGQSGSGLYVIVKGETGYETKLKGIVTWRIGGGVPGKTTAQGYEKNHGGAVLVDSLVQALEGKVNAKPVGDNYEPVIFERLLPKQRFVPVQPRYIKYPTKPKKVNEKQTVPYIKQDSDMVINPNRLIPLRPRPKPEPEPDIDVVPDIDVDPTPNPDSDNPYEDLPEFDIPVEIPPVVADLEKAEREKKELEAKLKAEEEAKAKLAAEAEAEKARLAAETARLEEEAKAEKLRLIERAETNEFYAWVTGGSAGGAGILALLWTLLKKKGKVEAVKFFKSKKPVIDSRLQALEEEALARLEARLGFSIPDIAKAKADLAEKKMIEEIERRLVARITGESVKQNVSFPMQMDPVEAHAESLSPEAIAILDDASRHAVLRLVNRTVTNIFKDRPQV